MSKPLAEELTEFQTTLDFYRKQYAEDGTITTDERSHLVILEAKIKRLRSGLSNSNAANGNAQLSAAPARADGTGSADHKNCTVECAGVYYLNAGGHAMADFGTKCGVNGKIKIPKDTDGSLDITVLYVGPQIAELLATKWKVDARKTGFTLRELGRNTKQIYDMSFLEKEEVTYDVDSDSESIKIKVNSTIKGTYAEPKKTTYLIKLTLEKTPSDKEKEKSDKEKENEKERRESQRVTDAGGTIWPFEIKKSELNNKLLDQLETIWKSLSRATRKDIRDNKMPMGYPVEIRGYASTTGPNAENFQLAGERAIKVREAIKLLSGNSENGCFKTISDGEGPAKTDRKSDEREDEKRRIVIVSLIDRSDDWRKENEP